MIIMFTLPHMLASEVTIIYYLFFEGKQGKACINSLLFFTYPSAVKESRNLPVFAGEENSSIPQIEELFLDITKRTLKEIQLTLLL